MGARTACRHFQLAVKFARLFRRLPHEVSSLADVFLEIVQLNMAIPEELDQLVVPAPDCSGRCGPPAAGVDAGLEVARKVQNIASRLSRAFQAD